MCGNEASPLLQLTRRFVGFVAKQQQVCACMCRGATPDLERAHVVDGSQAGEVGAFFTETPVTAWYWQGSRVLGFLLPADCFKLVFIMQTLYAENC